MVSKTAQYALRIAGFLAINTSGGVAFKSYELAEAANVPLHYASKVLRLLVASEILNSRKGHGGGFVLAQPLSTTRFIDILDAIEAPPVDAQCVFGLKACSDHHPCPLHFRWKEITQAFSDWAENTTLEDLRADARHR